MSDAIVIGSGPAGANAAAALIERGRRVLMLDVGDSDDRYSSLVPPQSFSEIRETDAAQHRYFLGDDLEGVPTGPVATGAQLTPGRAYVTRAAAQPTPIVSDTFHAAESLALGGLGNAWGAGVFVFDEHELADWPIARAELEPHYRAVARRIGIAAGRDDLERFFGPPADAMPPLEIDSNAETLLRRYARHRAELNAEGFFVGGLPLAVCTQRLGDRGPHAYRDMDFWADTDRSVYRPRFTVEELRRNERFRYADRLLVQRFEERDRGVTVTARRTDTGATETFEAGALLLAAGTLGTARIALRSLARFGERVPILCNPYTYAPAINWHMLGRAARDRRHSLAQLSAVYQPRPELGSRRSVQTQVFSYRSLLTFRLMKEAPIAQREALRVMRLLMPAFAILGISHDDRPTARKYCVLHRDGDAERFEVRYELSADEEERIERDERRVLSFFRRMGCWPIKRVRPGHGSSIHYAGTFPMTDGSRPSALGSRPDGRLEGTRAVYLVDGSVLPYLPAKGLTFTIMANADRVATRLAERLA